MASVVDYLSQIQKLTNTNLQILKTLNESFYTKKKHLFAEIDNETYVIPSFLSLENKLNALQENFENLVKAPETCEAYFNFDGNSRAIEVRKYNHTPDSIKLNAVSTFGVESNDIFKDFMTPVPYVNLDLPTMPNDIVQVNVKKVIAKNSSLKELFKANLFNGYENDVPLYRVSETVPYKKVYQELDKYKKGIDYIEYDTVYDLPIRKNLGNGTYVIESVIGDEIDTNLDEYITLKLRNDLKDSKYSNNLTYRLFDDTIEKELVVGDELVNFDGTGKVVITEIRKSTNTIVVKVVNGEYLNFIGTDSYKGEEDIHNLSKLRFHYSVDINEDKYVKIPLEEDQYVYIAVAPLNPRMKIQANWGSGIIIDTYSLKNGDVKFKNYYDSNVKNIGDILFELTSMTTAPVSSLSATDFESYVNWKPRFSHNEVQVIQINNHLDNSLTVKNIRDAYTQKKNAETELSEIQGKINEVNNHLLTISFDDTSGIRQIYTAQLSQLNIKMAELNTVISKATDRIYNYGNTSEIPIDSAKFRIRGFYVPEVKVAEHTIGVQVQYRYKNISEESGNAVSMTNGDQTYIYSDWNIMQGFNKKRVVNCDEYGVFNYGYEKSNENVNEPSYNQIDIPISKGETVDIRLRLVYDFGQPFATVMSNWSDIINVTFPDELLKDTSISKIIQENNTDFENSRVANILKEEGIKDHVVDAVLDQNITYFHKPESIASGFLTDERRIIPLKDKLQSMSNDIALLKSELSGTETNVSLSAVVGSVLTPLLTDQDNIIILNAFDDLVSQTPSDLKDGQSTTLGCYEVSKNDENNNCSHKISTLINLNISNTTNGTIKLYSIMPGNRDTTINDVINTRVDKNGYIITSDDKKGGVHYDWIGRKNENTLQKCNQFVTFRARDLWTGNPYYGTDEDEVIAPDNMLQTAVKIPSLTYGKTSMTLYPYLSNKYGISLDNDEVKTYKVLNPNSEIVVPIKCEFQFGTDTFNEIVKYISFDIKTSLYKDPVNYTIKVIVKRRSTVEDKMYNKNTTYNSVKYNIVTPK